MLKHLCHGEAAAQQGVKGKRARPAVLSPTPHRLRKGAQAHEGRTGPLEKKEEEGRWEEDPTHLPLRTTPNRSGCRHCPTPRCVCVWLADALAGCYAALPAKRQLQQRGRRELCAKSVLTPFVSRLVRLARLRPGETFYDLGCGNGSVLFQVALMTGVRCVGVEINPTNAEVARAAWEELRPTLERRCRRRLDIEIRCADLCEVLKGEEVVSAPCVIWAANLLLPKATNHYLSERLRACAVGTRIFCFEDLYPHNRSITRVRDPDAFERFEMKDFVWQPMSVEWCDLEGDFYLYTRK
ncbi:unnamed protein product [Phytomonas sp. EM1]|nr:unnamed protein product [Phytomonas sp. EM1]|eukprot:CCW59778.1 unnamed protein product [Phytomonas sp. isolate EM1]